MLSLLIDRFGGNYKGHMCADPPPPLVSQNQKLAYPLSHPSLEGRLTPWMNERESCEHPVLFVTNADKMAAALKDLYGQFLLYRVHFGLLLAL